MTMFQLMMDRDSWQFEKKTVDLRLDFMVFFETDQKHNNGQPLIIRQH